MATGGGSSALRQISKAGFGNAYRLEVAASIALHEGAEFTTMTVHQDTGIFYQRVHDVLEKFQKDGLIREVSAVQMLGKPYKAEPTPYWAYCLDLARELGWSVS